MAKLYAITLTHKVGSSQGKTGYHSIWRDEKRATNYAAKLNTLYCREFGYAVKPVTPERTASGLRGETQVKFSDSAGFLIVQ